jgi:hypothetical protein
MSIASPTITQTRVEAYAAAAPRLLGWLLGAILRLGLTGRSLRLQHMLCRAERAVESILFLQAVASYGPPPRVRHAPRAAPPGFRRVVGKRLALFFKRARVRSRGANALSRVLALIDALACPARAVAYFLKQLRKGLRLGRLVAAAPPDHALACETYVVAPAAHDTS